MLGCRLIMSFGSSWNRPAQKMVVGSSIRELRTEYRCSPRGLKQLCRGKRTFRSRIVTPWAKIEWNIGLQAVLQGLRISTFVALRLLILMDPNRSQWNMSVWIGTSTPSRSSIFLTCTYYLPKKYCYFYTYPIIRSHGLKPPTMKSQNGREVLPSSPNVPAGQRRYLCQSTVNSSWQNGHIGCIHV